MVAQADGRVNERIENYTKFWQKDISKDTEADTANRVESYTDVVNGTLRSDPGRCLHPLTRRRT